MKQRVLVTGGAGFIGSHVVDRLVAAGYVPRIFDVQASPWHDPEQVETHVGDVRDLDDVRAALEGCDAVCHLAAAADVDRVLKSPAPSTNLNAMGTVNVLQAARELEIQRVVYASTVWVYSDVEADEVNEDTLLPSPSHLYTAGKLSGELFCRSYAALYGLEPTVLRFGIPYGPRARPTAVIPAFTRRALDGEALTIAGTGEQERAFVYVEDLADGVVRALAPAAAGRTYNLAPSETTTIRGLAEIVRDQVAPVEIIHTEGRVGDTKGVRVCSERARAELGWTAATPLSVGVRRYADWVRTQPEGAPEPVVAAEPQAEDPEPVAEPVLANAPRAARGRSVRARLAAAVSDPIIVGAMAMIAVISSIVQMVADEPRQWQHTSLITVSIALLLPVWSVMVAHWPADLRRAQAAAAALTGAFAVILLGVVEPAELADMGHRTQALLLCASAAAAAVVRVVPRRVRSSADSA